jgi:ABC-type glycerol-3-phosphate transport system permease component
MTKVGIAKKEKEPGRVAKYLERNRATNNNYLLKRDVSRIAVGLFTTILLFGLCFLILQPLLHQFSNSIMSRNDLLDPTVIAIPREPTLDNYNLASQLMNYFPNFSAMSGGFNVRHLGSLVNTTWITALVFILQIGACTLVAYGFARFEFPLKKLWFACVILTVLVPPQVIRVPMFLNFRFFDISIVTIISFIAFAVSVYLIMLHESRLKSFWTTCALLISAAFFFIVPALVVSLIENAVTSSRFALNPDLATPFVLDPGIFSAISGGPLMLTGTLPGYLLLSVTAMGLRNGLFIFMLRQYFRNMPKELEESAWVDGCGKLQTFIKIMLPDAVPMLVSCFLFAFVWQWTDGFFTSMFLQGFGVMAVQMNALGETFAFHFVQQTAASTGTHGMRPDLALIEAMISTGVLIGIAPIILIYLVAQRFFVESIGQSGIKM